MRYAKVECRVWHDEHFRSFGAPAPNAQFLFLYLLTSPARTLIPGVLHISFSTVFAQFGWSERAGWCQVDALAELGMVRCQDDLIWLPNALSYNRPSNPNIVRGWRKTLNGEVPECELRDHIEIGIRAFLAEFPLPFRQAFAPGRKAKVRVPKGSVNGSGNPSANGSGNGSPKPGLVVRRIKSNSNRSERTTPPAADAAGASDYFRVLHLAQQHLDALRAEPTEADRMDVLKTICARHHVVVRYSNLVGRVLSDRRIAGRVGGA